MLSQATKSSELLLSFLLQSSVMQVSRSATDDNNGRPFISTDLISHRSPTRDRHLLGPLCYTRLDSTETVTFSPASDRFRPHQRSTLRADHTPSPTPRCVLLENTVMDGKGSSPLLVASGTHSCCFISCSSLLRPGSLSAHSESAGAGLGF